MPPVSQETREKLSKALKGIPRTAEWIEKARQANLGKKHIFSIEGLQRQKDNGLKIGGWNRGTSSSKKTREKLRNINLGKRYSEETKAKHRVSFTGENNPRWKGGITPINKKIRNSLEYKLWRKAVFERDNYTCVWCKDKRGGNLNADHIKSFALFPELRLSIDNGRTLCLECHKKTDSYLSRNVN